MSSTHVLIRSTLTPEESEQLAVGGEGTSPLRLQPGFVGMSTWQQPLDESKHLSIIEFTSTEASEDALKRFIEDSEAHGQPNVPIGPAPDIISINVERNEGLFPTEAPLNSLLSLGIRIAEPGYEKELKRDYDTIFTELKLIPGFAGFYFGSRIDFAEEVVALALWHNIEAYTASLPSSTPRELQLYRRIR